MVAITVLLLSAAFAVTPVMSVNPLGECAVNCCTCVFHRHDCGAKIAMFGENDFLVFSSSVNLKFNNIDQTELLVKTVS